MPALKGGPELGAQEAQGLRSGQGRSDRPAAPPPPGCRETLGGGEGAAGSRADRREEGAGRAARRRRLHLHGQPAQAAVNQGAGVLERGGHRTRALHPLRVSQVLPVPEGQAPVSPAWSHHAAHLDEGLPDAARTDQLIAEDHAQPA